MRLSQMGNRQVNWFEVYEFVKPLLAKVTSWPAAGTPEWQHLDDDDPRKLAAVLDAGVRWALRIDAEQTARAEASQDISAAVDCKSLARDLRNHEAIRIRRAS